MTQIIQDLVKSCKMRVAMEYVLTTVFIKEVGLQVWLEDWASDSDVNKARTEESLEGLQVETCLLAGRERE